jgi:hypothetical protein
MLQSHVAAVAAPARDRTVQCSIGLNAPGVNADEQVAGHGGRFLASARTKRGEDR